jgi:hypothetical protein
MKRGEIDAVFDAIEAAEVIDAQAAAVNSQKNMFVFVQSELRERPMGVE